MTYKKKWLYIKISTIVWTDEIMDAQTVLQTGSKMSCPPEKAKNKYRVIKRFVPSFKIFVNFQ